MKNGERQKIESKNKTHRSVISLSFPTETTCPVCGYEVELWTAEDEARCYICGYKIFQKETTIH